MWLYEVDFLQVTFKQNKFWSTSTLDVDMSDVLKRESNFRYKNVFMDP